MESLRWLLSRIQALPLSAFYGAGMVLLLLALIYYPLGMLIVHKVDDRLEFNAGQLDTKGDAGSHAVAIMVALLNREVVQNSWTPSDPFFMPGSMLDRMPAFQRGIVAALSRVAVEMMDQMGRIRGSSQIDADLEDAAGKLKYAPDVFMFDTNISIMPVASSESQFRGAMQSLQRYQNRLIKGEAVFERRSDNLIEVIDRMASDLGSASAAIANRIHDRTRPWLDNDADALYYDNKGRMYAYYLVMRELRRDYSAVIEEKKLGPAWDNTITSLAEGARLRSFFVFNFAPDSQFFPNQLTGQGFYLLRARTQLKELSGILMR